MAEIIFEGLATRRERFEAQKASRKAFINDVRARWDAYLKDEAVKDEYENATDSKDRLLHLAITLIDQVAALDRLGLVDDVTVSNMDSQKYSALSTIRQLTDFDEINEAANSAASSGDIMQGKWNAVHPVELMIGELVQRARILRATWKEIGYYMGITGQAAQRKAREKGWVNESEALPGIEE